jgi:hypothetical protein
MNFPPSLCLRRIFFFSTFSSQIKEEKKSERKEGKKCEASIKHTNICFSALSSVAEPSIPSLNDLDSTCRQNGKHISAEEGENLESSEDSSVGSSNKKSSTRT